MYGLVQPPPRPRTCKTSLDALHPGSGTAGLSPTRRRVRRVTPSSLIFNAAYPAGDECSLTNGAQNPLERLQQLLSQILMVLKAYCAKRHTSQACVVALREFYRRAVALDPVLSVQFADCDPVEVVCAMPQRNEQGGKLARRGSATAVPASSNRSVPGRILTPARQPTSSSPTRATPPRAPDPTAKQVDDLEKDWWSSEVAAMWYGPRPGNRLITMSAGDAATAKRRQSTESWVSGASMTTVASVASVSSVPSSTGTRAHKGIEQQAACKAEAAARDPEDHEAQVPAGSHRTLKEGVSATPGAGSSASLAAAQRASGGEHRGPGNIHHEVKSESPMVFGSIQERHDLNANSKPQSGSSGLMRRSVGFAGMLTNRSVVRPVKA